MDSLSIDVQNISKTFRIFHERRNSIFEQVQSIFSRKKFYEELLVLDNISFNVKKGEMLGIIGINGSGKTTLLKLIAHIFSTDKGKIITSGRVTPLLQLGVGFQPELTAIENIILYGMILGFTKNQIKNKIDSIIEFAELENFADIKLKNFSSGMYSRLAFSTTLQIEPDILLVDEVLSVGDLHFQEKSFKAFSSILKKEKSVVLVSHNLNTLNELCDRILFLNKGKIEALGKPDEVIPQYTKMIDEIN